MNWHKTEASHGRFVLVIIGGGSTGLMAAGFAVQLGTRVALVEKHRLGGECTWTGCVPSKTLLKAAKVAHQMRTADHYGLPAVEPEVDLKSVMAQVGAVVTEVYHEESPDALRADGIDVFLGAARFLDPHTLAAGETTLTAHHILIATGAHPIIPPVAGLDGVDCMTYETIWNLEVLPRHLLVVGAGPLGCEMAHAGLTEAQARARFGDEVKTHEWPMERVDRARAEGDTAGFIKLVHKQDGTLLGTTIVAGRAGEMITSGS